MAKLADQSFADGKLYWSSVSASLKAGEFAKSPEFLARFPEKET